MGLVTNESGKNLTSQVADLTYLLGILNGDVESVTAEFNGSIVAFQSTMNDEISEHTAKQLMETHQVELLEGVTFLDSAEHTVATKVLRIITPVTGTLYLPCSTDSSGV